METEQTTGNVVEIPASDEPAPTPKPRKIAATKSTKGAAKPRAKTPGYPMTPKQLASELKIDPKKLRRYIREAYGTHHKAWNLDKTQCDALRKKLGAKAKATK